MEMIKIPIVDIRGKEIGTLEFSQNVVNIVKITGIDFIMRYNAKTATVTAWME